MKILITGGCGFLGSNLAHHGIKNGYDITIVDNLSRYGSSENLKWLRSQGDFRFYHIDTRNKNDIETIIKQEQFDGIFHLAGQVAMTTSIDNPYKDFETNVLGTINVLDSVRKYSPQTSVLYSSTNKVYGELEQYDYEETETRYLCKDYPRGFNESVPLDFRSPYGCSKGSADQYMLDYYRMFGIKTAVFRHSSMYGSRQYATYDQGWVGWFVKKALDIKKGINTEPFTISGNGKQVRDVLHSKDMVSLYYLALENINKICGEAYNIGGTIEQSFSLIELFNLLEKMLGISMNYTTLPPRQSDQKVFVADITKISNKLAWKPNISAVDGIKEMIEWMESE